MNSKGQFFRAIISASIFIVCYGYNKDLTAQITEASMFYEVQVINQIDSSLIKEQKMAIFVSPKYQGKVIYDQKGRIIERSFIDFENKSLSEFWIEFDENEASEKTFRIQNLSAEQFKYKTFLSFGDQEEEYELLEDKIYTIKGLPCKKYGSKGNPGGMMFFMTDSIYYSDDLPTVVKGSNDKLMVMTESQFLSTSIKIILDTIVESSIDTAWISTDTTGMINFNVGFQEYLLENSENLWNNDDQMLSGTGRNLDLAKFFYEEGLLDEYILNSINRNNLDADFFELLGNIVFNTPVNKLEWLIDTLVDMNQIPDRCREDFAQFNDEIKSKRDYWIFYLHNQILADLLENKENRVQLIDNIKSTGILALNLDDEINKDFIQGNIDFSEYLALIEFIKPYPILNEELPFDSLSRLVFDYINIIIPSEGQDVKVNIHEVGENRMLEVTYQGNPFSIDLSNIFHDQITWINNEDNSDSYTINWPDKVMISREIYINLDKVVFQLLTDSDQKYTIQHMDVPGYFSPYRRSPVRSHILLEKPEWGIFKHEQAVQMIPDKSDDEKLDEIIAFYPHADNINASYLSKFKIFTDFFGRSVFLKTSEKVKLRTLLESEYGLEGLNSRSLDDAMNSLIPKDISYTCEFLNDKCLGLSYLTWPVDTEDFTFPNTLEQMFPSIYNLFEGTINPTIVSYDANAGILGVKLNEEVHYLGKNNYLILAFMDFINENIPDSNKQLLIFSHAFSKDLNYIYITDELSNQLAELFDIVIE